MHTFDIASFYAGSMSVHEVTVCLSPLQDFHTIATCPGYEKFIEHYTCRSQSPHSHLPHLSLHPYWLACWGLGCLVGWHVITSHACMQSK